MSTQPKSISLPQVDETYVYMENNNVVIEQINFDGDKQLVFIPRQYLSVVLEKIQNITGLRD